MIVNGESRTTEVLGGRKSVRSGRSRGRVVPPETRTGRSVGVRSETGVDETSDCHGG